MVYSNSKEIPSSFNQKPALVETSRNEETISVSKLREAVPQICAVSAKNLLLMTFGTTLGFPTILIPELQKDNAEITVSVEELTWISSINLFMVPLGGFISGPVSQKFGRRKAMMITTIPFVVAWLTFHYATNAMALLFALALTGLTGGLLEAPVLTYVAEVTQPHLRGMLSATSTMAVICGVFTQMLTGSLVSWRVVVLVNIVYPVICFLALSLVPESPSWLISKGRVNDAEDALCWLRGWVHSDHIKSEFSDLLKQYQKPVHVATIDSVVTNFKDPAVQEPSQKRWGSYLLPTFYTPFFIVTLAFFIIAFGGIMTLQTFAVSIFESLKSPIDKYTATVIMGVAQVFGTIICVCIIHFTGKRKLTFVSATGTGVALFLTSIYGILISNGTIVSEGYSWIPTTLIISAMFFSHLALKSLPWILAGEVFPPNVRSVATGAAGSIGYILSSIANKIFIYMERGLTLPGTFLIYSAVCFGGFIVMYYMLPETEGRTLKEIEDHFSGACNLKYKPKSKVLIGKEKWAIANPIAVKDEDTRL